MIKIIKTIIASLFFFCATSEAKTIHVVYPAGSTSYKSIAKSIYDDISRWQNNNNNNYKITVSNSLAFPVNSIKPRDLIVNISRTNITKTYPDLLDIDILFTFNTRYSQHALTKLSHHTHILIDQPLTPILETAKKVINKNYRKTILIITSEENKRYDILNEELEKNLKFVNVKDGENAAKKIEPCLDQAGAIAAIYDPKIWSGNSARWILQQAYNNKVPVIGYSKAFLKAGAVSSVYSSSDQIIAATNNQIINWIENEKFESKVIYPDYSIEVNNNIAKALNLSSMEIIELGKKQ